MQSSKEVFEENVRANAEACAYIRDEYQKRFEQEAASTLYGLPLALIEAISREAPTLASREELRLERSLADLLQHRSAVGLVDGKFIQSSLFPQRSPVTVTREDFDALGWKEFGLDLKSVNRMTEEAEQRALPFHEQLCSYAGWLITNATFLNEVDELRQDEVRFQQATSTEAAMPFMEKFSAFLSNWQLAKMVTWDIPEPQGPNLAGFDLPFQRARTVSDVVLRIPLTTGLPARMAVNTLVAEIREDVAGDHLEEWLEVLDRRRNGATGLQGFRSILRIRFFRDVVLASRYGGRFEGNVERLDRAFGDYLQVGPKNIQILRSEIDDRLKGDAGDGAPDRRA